MRQERKALEELVGRLERNYENYLQSEEGEQVAYIEGVIAGVKMAIEELDTVSRQVTPKTKRRS